MQGLHGAEVQVSSLPDAVMSEAWAPPATPSGPTVQVRSARPPRLSQSGTDVEACESAAAPPVLPEARWSNANGTYLTASAGST